MKKPVINLTSSDIEVIQYALSLLPMLDYDLSDAQQFTNNSLCTSCLEKISNNMQNFSLNETRVIYCALGAMNEIIQNEFDIEPEIIARCQSYLFTVNKLLPLFEATLPID